MQTMLVGGALQDAITIGNPSTLFLYPAFKTAKVDTCSHEGNRKISPGMM
jgi:hypothetical protein